jgi:hypothetical protein
MSDRQPVRDAATGRWAEKHGLYRPRPRTCEHCKAVFPARKPSARFCSTDCTRAATGYGRNYGQYAPKALGETNR